jgi:hypothetical protein
MSGYILSPIRASFGEMPGVNDAVCTRRGDHVAKKQKKTSKSQGRGMSLHIGLNAVSPDHYSGWSGDLIACEFDANDMAAIRNSWLVKSAQAR